VPESQEDHCGVSVSPTVALGAFDELLDLLGRQVLAGPQVPVRAASRRNCSIYGGWWHQPQAWFCH
jgi:hypothetical protein